MQLDIRVPMGLLFSLLGVILSIYGLMADPAIYDAHSLGRNVNLYWGLICLVFGMGTLWLARRGNSSHQ